MEEDEHVISVLQRVRHALKVHDANSLRALSNNTIHSASAYQDAGSISLAVLVYTLAKLIERHDYKKIKHWNRISVRLDSNLGLAINSLKAKKSENYHEYLQKAIKSLYNVSVDLKPYLEEVIRKASINKASKIYEHGISLGRTAHLLGLTQWELSEYTGQKEVSDRRFNENSPVKARAKMALEFFS